MDQIVLNYVRNENNIEYIIKVIFDEREIKIQARYSILLNIHENFANLNKGKPLPSFPPKRLFGNKKDKFLKERKR